MRRAVTLVEALMGGLIAALILGALYQIFIGGLAAFGRNTRSADAMLNALIALETLSGDLAQLHTTEKDAAAPFAGLRPLPGEPGPVKLDAAARSLAFRVARAGPTPLSDLEVQDVSWSLRPAGARPGIYQICRDDKPLADVLVKRLEFEFFPADHPESHEVLYIRTVLVGTDPLGIEEFALSRLTALPVPTSMVAKQRFKKLLSGGPAKAAAP